MKEGDLNSLLELKNEHKNALLDRSNSCETSRKDTQRYYEQQSARRDKESKIRNQTYLQQMRDLKSELAAE